MQNGRATRTSHDQLTGTKIVGAWNGKLTETIHNYTYYISHVLHISHISHSDDLLAFDLDSVTLLPHGRSLIVVTGTHARRSPG